MPDDKKKTRKPPRVQNIEVFREHLDALLTERTIEVREGDTPKRLSNQDLYADLTAFAARYWPQVRDVFEKMLVGVPSPRLSWIATEISLMPSVLVRSKSTSQSLAATAGAAGVLGLRLASTPLLGSPNWTPEFTARALSRRSKIIPPSIEVPKEIQALVLPDETGMWRGSVNDPEIESPSLVQLQEVIDFAARVGANLAVELRSRSAYLNLLQSENERKGERRAPGLRVVEHALELSGLAKIGPKHAFELERDLRVHLVRQASRHLEILNRLNRSINALRCTVVTKDKALSLWAELVAISWYEFGNEIEWLQTLDANRLHAFHDQLVNISRHPALEMVESVLRSGGGLDVTRRTVKSAPLAPWQALDAFPQHFDRQRPFRDGPGSLVGAWIEQLNTSDALTGLRTLLNRAQTVEQRLWLFVGAVNVLALSRLTVREMTSLVDSLAPGEQIVVLAALLRRLRRELFESEVRSLKTLGAQLARYKSSADLASSDARSVAPWLPEHVWSASAAVSHSIASFVEDLRRQVDERVPPSFLTEEGLPAGSRSQEPLSVLSQALRFDPTRGAPDQRAARRNFQAMVVWSLDEESNQLLSLLRDPSLPPEAWTALWEVGISRNHEDILATLDRLGGESWAIESFVALLLRHAGGLAAPLNLSPDFNRELLKTLKSLLEEAKATVTRPTQLSTQVRESVNALRQLRDLLSDSINPVAQWVAQLERIEEDATQTRR